MGSRSLTHGVFAVLLTLAIVGAAPLAQGSKTAGAATPQDAVAVIRKSAAANDMMMALPVVSPSGLKELASEGINGLLMVLAFSDPDDAMPGTPKPPAAELALKRKQYKEAVATSAAVLKPYGLDTAIGKPVMADATQQTISAALDKADKVAFITSLYGSMMKIGPLLGMKSPPKPTPLVDLGNVTGYKITGDKAVAQNGAEVLNFTRIDGRWYIEPPASKTGGATGPSSGPAASNAPQGPAPRAAATGKNPEVVVGGIQIARVVLASDDFSAKPFNSDNGTKIALWVKMPAGQGLIEIDEDNSLLQAFRDDKGTNLGGEFDSFPEEFKDASGGTIEIESNALPAAGATTLQAEGTLAMTVATGTRKTRIANVGLKNDVKFTFEKTPMTVSEVETQDEFQTFTLNLPRQVMIAIKNVIFLDAKAQPLEGSRTSSGYMNDDAQMGFRVKTASKVVTMEFESWQGQRTIKVPFNVKAGLGLN
jgi:hypothetical protein